jgi:hypothetical protein
MTDNIIVLEGLQGAYQEDFHRLLKLIPSRDRTDQHLHRLLAFRLKLDGYDSTQRYVLNKLRVYRRCPFGGSLFDFLKDDKLEKKCLDGSMDPSDEPA